MRFQLRLGGLSFRGSCEYTEGLADAAEGVYELPTAVPEGPRLASKRTSKGPTSRGSRWSRQDKVFSSRSERLTKEKVFAKRRTNKETRRRYYFDILLCIFRSYVVVHSGHKFPKTGEKSKSERNRATHNNNKKRFRRKKEKKNYSELHKFLNIFQTRTKIRY